jgi:hypothetical protein
MELVKLKSKEFNHCSIVHENDFMKRKLTEILNNRIKYAIGDNGMKYNELELKKLMKKGPKRKKSILISTAFYISDWLEIRSNELSEEYTYIKFLEVSYHV